MANEAPSRHARKRLPSAGEPARTRRPGGSDTDAYTATFLAGAALAVPIGRRLVAHGGRALMIAGSAAGALLIAWSQIDSL